MMNQEQTLASVAFTIMACLPILNTMRLDIFRTIGILSVFGVLALILAAILYGLYWQLRQRIAADVSNDLLLKFMDFNVSEKKQQNKQEPAETLTAVPQPLDNVETETILMQEISELVENPKTK